MAGRDVKLMYEIIEFVIMQRLIENVYNLLLKVSGRRIKQTENIKENPGNFHFCFFLTGKLSSKTFRVSISWEAISAEEKNH